MPLDSLRPGSGIARLFLGRQDQAGTGAEAAEQVEDRQIEVQRGDRQQAIRCVHPQQVEQRVDGIDRRRVADLDALGHPGGARGVDHIGTRLRRQRHGGGQRRAAQQALDIQARRQGLRIVLLGDRQAYPGGLFDQAPPCGRLVDVQRHVAGACGEHAEYRRDLLRSARQADLDRVARAHPGFAQAAGDAQRTLGQFAAGDTLVAIEQRVGIRRLGGAKEEVAMQGARRGACRLAVEQGPARLLRPGQRQIGGLLPGAVAETLEQPHVGFEHGFRQTFGEQADDAIPGQQDTVAHPVELVVEPDLRGLREHVVEIAESVAEGRRDEALLAQVAGEHHRRRAWLALPARLAEHLQGGECGVVDGSVEVALEALHRLGEGHPGLHPALQQQQGGEVGDHLADTRVVGMPIEQRHVEEKFRAFAPARQDQREGAAEHAGQGHAMLRGKTLQAPALAGGKLECQAPGARLADAFRRAGQRQGRRVRQARQAFQPVVAGPRRGLGALRRTVRQVVGEMQRRRLRQALRRQVGNAQFGQQQAQAFDIGGKQVETQPEAILAARHAHQPEQEHLAALHRQAFMGAPVAQRLPVALGLVHL